MNIRFTVEEENLIAIYAEDSRKRQCKISLRQSLTWTAICSRLQKTQSASCSV